MSILAIESRPIGAMRLVRIFTRTLVNVRATPELSRHAFCITREGEETPRLVTPFPESRHRNHYMYLVGCQHAIIAKCYAGPCV
jgi:hypothetical protein